MSDLRIRYGLAYGRMNNFYAGSTDQTKRGYQAGTDGLFAQANTAPDVTTGYIFYTNNSAATTITDFQVGPLGRGTGGNQAPLFEGKVIQVMFLDSNTTVAGPRIYLSNSDSTFNSNALLELYYHNSAWYEINRTQPYSQNVSYTFGGSAGLNANYTSSILFTGESALVIVSLSNGYIGQRILLVNGDSGTNITVSTGGNLRFSGTLVSSQSGQYQITSNGVAEFVKLSPTIWSMIGR